jgi:peptide/nickel transport system substrate-binding protein
VDESSKSRGYARRGLVAMLMVMCAGLVAGVVPAAASSTAETTGHGALNVVGSFNFPTLDPSLATASTGSGQPFFFAIYDSLFKLGASGQTLPELATGDTVSKNGLTVTLALRKGVKFSDGTPFNSTAVKFNLQRDTANDCTCIGYLADITNIATPNPLKVVITLSQPYAPLIAALTNSSAAYIVSPSAISSEGATAFGQAPVGAGPYKVVSDNPQVVLTVARNSRYWNARAVKLASIVFTNIATTSSQFATVEAGQAQMMIAADPTSITQAKSAGAAYKLLQSSPTSWFAVQFNTTTAPFNNINAREAVEYALNPKAISTAVTGGLYTPNQSVYGSGMEDYWGTTTKNYHAYSTSQAQSLVQGLPGGKLTFSIFGRSKTAIYEETMQAMQQELSQAGITMNIVNLTHAQAIAQNESGNFQTILNSYGGFSDDGVTASTFFQSGGTFATGVNDPVLNNYVAEANGTSVASKRKADFLAMSEYINKMSYWDPIFTYSTYDIVASNVKGYAKSPLLYLDSVYFGNS